MVLTKLATKLFETITEGVLVNRSLRTRNDFLVDANNTEVQKRREAESAAILAKKNLESERNVANAADALYNSLTVEFNRVAYEKQRIGKQLDLLEYAFHGAQSLNEKQDHAIQELQTELSDTRSALCRAEGALEERALRTEKSKKKR